LIRSARAGRFVLVAAGEESRVKWNAIGLRPMKERGLWRDAHPGDYISLPETNTDTVVLVKTR
jgi:hypothetical protein